MGSISVSWGGVFLTSLLVLIPLGVGLFLRLRLTREILISVTRMIIQLSLIGILLSGLFKLNNPILTIAWLLVMAMVASPTVLKGAGLERRFFLIPVFFTMLVSVITIVSFINGVVLKTETVYDAKYLIVLSGMLLGNTLKGNIIGLRTFYSSIRKGYTLYQYTLSLGASRTEVVIPYLREALHAALQPTLANMAVMGIVFLPGMMTGAILGGASPIDAITYQIMIMLAIFSCTTLGVLLTILITIRSAFDGYGMLRDDRISGKDKKGSRANL